MYLNIKCNCTDLVLELKPHQIIYALTHKCICEECGCVYKLKPSLTYDKKKYMTMDLLEEKDAV